MTVFEAFPFAVETVGFSKKEEDKMSGKVRGAITSVRGIFVDESKTDFDKIYARKNDGILFYAIPTEEISTRDCIDGTISTVLETDPRRFRIKDFATAKNQETGEVEHIELTLLELGGLL